MSAAAVTTSPSSTTAATTTNEEDASIALARHLMAEEAMNSYSHHLDLLQTSDLSNDEFGLFIEEQDDNSSYDAFLQLGDRLGSVKAERYSMMAVQEIAKLPICKYCTSDGSPQDNSSCLVCQCEFQDQEELRVLPCQHRFHVNCVDPWLMEKDVCPLCRESILANK